MKKTVKLILAFSLTLLLGLSFTACDPGESTHTHEYRSIWSYNDTYHWYACVDEDCSKTSKKAEHAFVNNICTVCGYAKVETIACSYTVVSAPMSENGLYVMDSVTDGERNYYLLDLGYAENVPIWSGQPREYNKHMAGYPELSFSKGKEFQTTVEKTISNTISKTVSDTSMNEFGVSASIEAGLGKSQIAKLKASVSYSRTWGYTNEKQYSTTSAYSTAQTIAESYDEGYTVTIGGSGYGWYRFSIVETCDIYVMLETDINNTQVFSTVYTICPRGSGGLTIEYSQDGTFVDASVDKIRLPENYFELLPEPSRIVEKEDSNLIENKVDYAGGCGTEESPYLISTSQHLKNIEKNMSAHYKMIADVDLSAEEWEPIGGFYLQNTFKGCFDGDGYSIKSLTRSTEVVGRSNRSYFGLFGGIGSAGIVKNVEFKSVNIDTEATIDNADMRAFHGVVAGKCAGTIDNVSIAGTYSIYYDVKGEAWAGGICGYAVNAKISNCINNIDIKVDGLSSIVGGIVGYAEGGRIEKCENKGEIAAIGYWDGWLLSWWSGTAWAAPICAASHSSRPVTIIDCLDSGTVSATGGRYNEIGTGRNTAAKNDATY